ncbi:hypothetical protein, partial [Enterococcus gallinarum]|uniref:hypothetical protein n=1 Tax=Enterococcus gallinarum TaxID=1353 RepID=UPI001957A657
QAEGYYAPFSRLVLLIICSVLLCKPIAVIQAEGYYAPFGRLVLLIINSVLLCKPIVVIRSKKPFLDKRNGLVV